MATFICQICQYQFDEKSRGMDFFDLPDKWICPECGGAKGNFVRQDKAEPARVPENQDINVYREGLHAADVDLAKFLKNEDGIEKWMEDIQAMAADGQSIEEPMRTRLPVQPSWDDVLFLGRQLSRLPLLADENVVTQTVIGPRAEKPLFIDTPIMISHMSYGSVSRDVHMALAKASSLAGTSFGSGEGGILPAALTVAGKFIFEYVPNQYSVTPENLSKVDAVELKFGQSTNPGMGSCLSGIKVTEGISKVRGLPVGEDIKSPSRFPDIHTPKELAEKIAWLREATKGHPIGVKIAAGHIEEDLDFIIEAQPDFITLDGRPGGTGAALKYVKLGTSVPTLFALARARRHLDRCYASKISLIVTGGLRVSSDIAKALAMGADAVALGTSALMAIGGRGGAVSNGPQGQEVDAELAARRVANFIKASTRELTEFARLTGKHNVHEMNCDDLCTVNREIAEYTGIKHV